MVNQVAAPGRKTARNWNVKIGEEPKLRNYKVIGANEEIMKTASDTFFRQFVEWMNSESIENAGCLQEAAEVIRTEFLQKSDWYNALIASIYGYLQETDGSVPYDQMAVELANRFIGIEPEEDKDSIDSLDLTVRTYVCLKRAGIDTVSQLRNMPVEDFREITNLNQQGIDEIRKKLL